MMTTLTTPNTDRSTTDTHDSGSEANYNHEYEAAELSNCNSYDLISHNLDHIISTSNAVKDKECVVKKKSNVPGCRMNRDQLDSLNNSTKKLLCLLEDVQTKTHSTALVQDEPPKMSDVLRPMANWDPDSCDLMVINDPLSIFKDSIDRSVTDIIGGAALQRLEKQTQDLESIVITDKDDDCSVYKRLIRKCHCLNQQEYNDFIIHFNEQTKFCTNTIGEIIKNMFIMKKFLYIGGKYTKNALLFLNQGLEEGTYTEKADIIQACAFADICCVFDTYTIVTMCISWPCKNRNLQEEDTQEMTAKFLYNLSRLEEGRRYLNFNAKIICDIKKVLKKKQDKISCDTVEMLNLVLNACQPQIERPGMNSLTYHCRPIREGIGNKTLNALMAYRQHMTLNELFLNLDILKSLSGNEETKMQLTPHLPSMLTLFKNMILEFNNRDMNLIITNIMNNIVGDSVARNEERESAIVTGERITSCIATEPIKKKNVTIQVPVQKKSHKRVHHSPFKKSEHKEINRSRLLNPITASIQKSEQKEINRSRLLNPVTAAKKKSEQKGINRSRLLNPITAAIKKSEQKEKSRSRLLNPMTAAIKKSEQKGINRSRLLNTITADAIKQKNTISHKTNETVFQKRNSVTVNLAAAFHKPTENVCQREFPFLNRSRKFTSKDILNVIVVPMEENNAIK